ncbi:unnamed protein product [Urochloa humidicola]
MEADEMARGRRRIPLQLADRVPSPRRLLVPLFPGAAACDGASPRRPRARSREEQGIPLQRRLHLGLARRGEVENASIYACAGGEERRPDPAASGRRSSPLALRLSSRTTFVPSPSCSIHGRRASSFSPRGVQDPWRRWWGSRSCCLTFASQKGSPFISERYWLG